MSALPPQIAALPERYEVTRHIADGGMASVWCAHDQVLGRQVALKVLSPQYARDEGGGRRFIREGRAAARLSGHAHVVTIFDIGAADGLPYIVMEYLAGGTVADAIRVGAIDREQALDWIEQAASALDYAHQQGVVHRDVKPGNLLLDRQRTLHVADFGIAHLPREDTLSNARQIFGTTAYASPEQVRGERGSEASDRYALAVAAFELLVGERPFVAKPPTAQARQHLEEPPPRASERTAGMPAAVDEVLARGMAKRPEDRWPTASAFAAALAAAAAAADRTPAPAAAGLAAAAANGPPKAAAAKARRRAMGSPGRRPSGRALALAALAAAATAVGVVVGTEANRPSRARSTLAQALSNRERASAAARRRAAQAAARLAADTRRRHAAQLEADGHHLMLAGDYTAAIPVLRRAAATAGPGASQYAAALLDLGRSLRLGGDPQAAIPVLERRLRIPSHTQAVVTQLELAQLAAGQGPVSADANPSPPTAAPAEPEVSTSSTTQSSTTTSSSTTTKQTSTRTPRQAAPAPPKPRSGGSGGPRPGSGNPASGGAAPFPPSHTQTHTAPPGGTRPGSGGASHRG